MGEKILLTADYPLLRWQQRVAEKMRPCLSAVLVDDVTPDCPPGHGLYRFYEQQLERRWFRPRRVAFETVQGGRPLPVIRRSWGEAAFWRRMETADTVLSVARRGLEEALEHGACRLLLHFGARNLCPWDLAGNSPDVLAGAPQTLYGVYAFSRGQPGRRAMMVESATRTQCASQWQSKNTYCWGAADFFERALARLEAGAPAADDWEPWTPPSRTLGGTVLSLLRLGGAAAALKARRALGSKSWGTVLAAYKGLNAPVAPLCAFSPPKGHIWVDPFIVRGETGGFLFFENLPIGGRAEIWVLPLDAGGRQSGPARPALVEPFHLSFPNVFFLGGKWYMLPETLESGQLRLYACERFPDRWRLARVLMEGICASDAVLHHSGGLWWLFLSAVGHPGMPFDDELSLYTTDDLFSGSWTPHPQNPLVSDVRRARMAGALFEEGGRLIRPAQDCAGTYGQGLNFYEITKLTPREYCEVPYKRGEALFGRKLPQMHTFNQSGGWCVVDALLKPRMGRVETQAQSRR